MQRAAERSHRDTARFPLVLGTLTEVCVALAALEGLARPALVFLDLFMPVLDGLGFLNGLRGRPDRADFEVVVMSAVVNMEWFIQVPGILRALRKPGDLEDTLEIADSFARRPPAVAGASEASAAPRPAGFVGSETAPVSGPK